MPDKFTPLVNLLKFRERSSVGIFEAVGRRDHLEPQLQAEQAPEEARAGGVAPRASRLRPRGRLHLQPAALLAHPCHSSFECAEQSEQPSSSYQSSHQSTESPAASVCSDPEFDTCEQRRALACLP